MTEKLKKWKKVTPIPLEMNGHGFLWDCPYCGHCITSVHDYPKYLSCPKCFKKIARKDE